MVISIILGMGLPTPIAYILSAIFVAPALVEVGFPELGAHLFLFFFAIKSGSTPPIAVVAVVAAGIARANWWKTAWLSFVYSLPGFFIAFAFIFHASYLLEGAWGEILVSCICGLIGVAGMSFSLQRYLLNRLGLAEMLILAGSSLVVLFSRSVYLFLGLACILLVCSYQFMKFRKRAVSRESYAETGK
ncbi:MAG: TRAP transporter large permease subunit, partial [Desulfobacterales bacterium]|nr:TRAP transporter large permease subunit [Desulfobacterales bacterium]